MLTTPKTTADPSESQTATTTTHRPIIISTSTATTISTSPQAVNWPASITNKVESITITAPNVVSSETVFVESSTLRTSEVTTPEITLPAKVITTISKSVDSFPFNVHTIWTFL